MASEGAAHFDRWRTCGTERANLIQRIRVEVSAGGGGGVEPAELLARDRLCVVVEEAYGGGHTAEAAAGQWVLQSVEGFSAMRQLGPAGTAALNSLQPSAEEEEFPIGTASFSSLEPEGGEGWVGTAVVPGVGVERVGRRRSQDFLAVPGALVSLVSDYMPTGIPTGPQTVGMLAQVVGSVAVAGTAVVDVAETAVSLLLPLAAAACCSCLLLPLAAATCSAAACGWLAIQFGAQATASATAAGSVASVAIGLPGNLASGVAGIAIGSTAAVCCGLFLCL